MRALLVLLALLAPALAMNCSYTNVFYECTGVPFNCSTFATVAVDYDESADMSECMSEIESCGTLYIRETEGGKYQDWVTNIRRVDFDLAMTADGDTGLSGLRTVGRYAELYIGYDAFQSLGSLESVPDLNIEYHGPRVCKTIAVDRLDSRSCSLEGELLCCSGAERAAPALIVLLLALALLWA